MAHFAMDHYFVDVFASPLGCPQKMVVAPHSMTFWATSLGVHDIAGELFVLQAIPIVLLLVDRMVGHAARGDGDIVDAAGATGVLNSPTKTRLKQRVRPFVAI
mmetsp:Transcript_7170/g.21149  ORF Transcript_7170/g.21149 Transcript_7170/m.21149 type:complete len:103 (+) Transcript_7170:814-1122(+)